MDDASSDAATGDPPLSARARQAYHLLLAGFVAAPILAGVDKFFHLLADWDQYVAPVVETLVLGHGSTLLLVAGVIEIAAGIGMWFRPRVFAYVVAAWLGGIIVNLLLIPGFLDIALRDLGLLLGALALGRLSGALAE
jgi:hypothetical protein